MSVTRPDAAHAESLLLELARVRRTRQRYEPGHAKLVDALARAATLINGVLSADAAIDLELRDGALAIPGGRELRGPGLDELAEDLAAREVARLRVCRGLEEAEILVLAELLTQSPEALRRAGGIERSLREAGVEHISLPTCAPESPPPAMPPEAPLRPPLDESTEPIVVSRSAPQPDAPHATPTRSETPSDTATAPPEPQPGGGTGDTVALVRKLGELEACDDVSSYSTLSDVVGEHVRALLERKRCFDAYRALLLYCRHSTDSARPREICGLAADRLRDLMNGPELIEFVIEHACTTSGLTSVQATQVLVCYGAAAAEPLLARHAEATEELRRRTTSILIAMAQAVLPAIVNELQSPQPDSVRRAARLLGDMQNPAAVEFLIDALGHPNLTVRLDVANALTRIDTPRAVQALVDSFASSDETAEIAAGALGNSRGRAGLAALIEAVDERSELSDSVRREAVRSLGRLGGPDALEALRCVLESGSLLRRKRQRPLRIAAAQAIGRIGGEGAHEILEQTSGSAGDAAVQKACHSVLDQLTRAAR